MQIQPTYQIQLPLPRQAPLPAPILQSRRGTYAQDLKQVGSQRLVEYLNLGRDLIQVLQNPSRTFDAIKNTLLGSLGYGAAPQGILAWLQAFGGLISLVLAGFVEQRITPYVTAIKERNWSMVGALATVDVVDFLTFSAVLKGLQGLASAAKGAKAAGAAGRALRYLPTAQEVGKLATKWAVTNAVGNTMVQQLGGIPTQRVYSSYMNLKQNGLILNRDAYALFSREDFTGIERQIVYFRLIFLNQVNYVSGPIWQWQPGREQSSLKGSAQSATVQKAELDYLRFMPESRYETLQKLCDLNGGYAFYQHAFATVPNHLRADFPVIVDDLYAYNQFMTSIDPDYQLNRDPSRDRILTGQSDAQDLAVVFYLASYPGSTEAEAKAFVREFWRHNMPVGERPMAVHGKGWVA